MENEEVMATIRPSRARRGFGILALGLLGLILIYVAFAQPPSDLGWQLFLLIFGVAVIWAADVMRRATAHSLELTETVLRSTDGRILAEISEVRNIDRGLFAFKPSNGFLVSLRKPKARAWAPGLWWRIGRRVGVGGVTDASQTKIMAEILTAMIAVRDGG